MSSLNWGDLVKDAGDVGSFEPLPDGDYDLVVQEAVAKVSQSGKTMFSLKAQVQGGAHNKRLVWDNLVVTPESPAALGMFFRKMAALGLGREFFATSPSNAAIEQAVKGRAFRAQVGSRTWQGQKKNEIKMYYVATAPAGSPAATSYPARGHTPPRRNYYQGQGRENASHRQGICQLSRQTQPGLYTSCIWALHALSKNVANTLKKRQRNFRFRFGDIIG